MQLQSLVLVGLAGVALYLLHLQTMRYPCGLHLSYALGPAHAHLRKALADASRARATIEKEHRAALRALDTEWEQHRSALAESDQQPGNEERPEREQLGPHLYLDRARGMVHWTSQDKDPMPLDRLTADFDSLDCDYWSIRLRTADGTPHTLVYAKSAHSYADVIEDRDAIERAVLDHQRERASRAVDARQRAEQLKDAEAKYKHRRGDLLSQHRNAPHHQEAVSAWEKQAAAWETRTGRRPVWDLDLW